MLSIMLDHVMCAHVQYVRWWLLIVMLVVLLLSWLSWLSHCVTILDQCPIQEKLKLPQKRLKIPNYTSAFFTPIPRLKLVYYPTICSYARRYLNYASIICQCLATVKWSTWTEEVLWCLRGVMRRSQWDDSEAGLCVKLYKLLQS